MTPTEALLLAATATFRPFTQIDHFAFQGCETENPVIADTPTHLIVVDGDTIWISQHDATTPGQTFTLREDSAHG